MSSMESAATSAMLDTIDEIRTTLGGLKGASDQADSDFYEEILAVLPQFVAVGPQSAPGRGAGGAGAGSRPGGRAHDFS